MIYIPIVMNFPRRAIRAFTLIELLVVTAIIAILAALMFAGGRGFLDSSRNMRSTGNLREISRLHHIFIQENNGWLGTQSPPGENRNGAAYSLHLARIAGIIDSVNSPKPPEGKMSAMSTVFASPWNGPEQRLDGKVGYGFNTRLGHNRGTRQFFSHKLISCPVPSKTIVFAESPNTRSFWNWVHEDIETGFPLVRDGKVIVSWLDGHVTRETVEELIRTIDDVPFYYWSASKMRDPSGGGHVGWSATEYFP